MFILFVSPALYLFIDLWKHDETCIYNKESEGQTLEVIDIDTDKDISYMRGAFWEVPVPTISVDVHLGYHI